MLLKFNKILPIKKTVFVPVYFTCPKMSYFKQSDRNM